MMNNTNTVAGSVASLSTEAARISALTEEISWAIVRAERAGNIKLIVALENARDAMYAAARVERAA